MNFGSIYGIGASGSAERMGRQRRLDFRKAKRVGNFAAFAASFPGVVRWRHEHFDRCSDRGCVVIGRDAARGIGRLFPEFRLNGGRSFYTLSMNLPVQGRAPRGPQAIDD